MCCPSALTLVVHRYRFEVRSDKLWSEIAYVLDILAAPLTELFQNTFAMIKVRAARRQALAPRGGH